MADKGAVDCVPPVGRGLAGDRGAARSGGRNGETGFVLGEQARQAVAHFHVHAVVPWGKEGQCFDGRLVDVETLGLGVEARLELGVAADDRTGPKTLVPGLPFSWHCTCARLDLM